MRSDTMRRNCRHFSIELCLCTVVVCLCGPLEAALQQVPQIAGDTSQAKLAKSPANWSVSSDAIASLMEEISRLKLELVPDSAKQIVPAISRPPTLTPLPPTSAAQMLGDLKAIQIKKRSNVGDKHEQTQEQQERRQLPDSTKSSKTICDQSIAVATLGYMVLCPRPAKPSLASSGQAGATHPSSELANSLPESSLVSELESELSSLNVAIANGSQDGPGPATVATGTTIDGNEVAQLLGLIDKLARHSNFRSIST